MSRAINDGPAPPGFKEAVMADLQSLYETPTGRKLLESLQASGKRIELFYGKANGAAFPGANTEYPHGYWPPAFYAEDGITPGAGTAMGIAYNPFNAVSGEGKAAWLERPPAIGLAHELIHAEQAAYGRMRRNNAFNGKGPDPQNPNKLDNVQIFELETVGVPPHDSYAISENKIRAEWNPPQPRREYY